ncbi:MAG: hypothetical protein QXD03_02480 [Candidatus Anstonellales archaeon]
MGIVDRVYKFLLELNVFNLKLLMVLFLLLSTLFLIKNYIKRAVWCIVLFVLVMTIKGASIELKEKYSFKDTGKVLEMKVDNKYLRLDVNSIKGVSVAETDKGYLVRVSSTEGDKSLEVPRFLFYAIKHYLEKNNIPYFLDSKKSTY